MSEPAPVDQDLTQRSGGGWTPLDLVIAAALTSVALVLRLLFLGGSPARTWPHSLLYEGDAPLWTRWGDSIQAGASFEFDLPLWPPGTAYLMSWLLPTMSLLAIKRLWCVVGAAGIALAYLAFRQRFSRGVSLTAASIMVFAFGSYMLSTSLNNEVWYTLAIVTIVLLTQAQAHRQSIVLAILLGVLHGAATLLRAEHSLLLLLFIGFGLLGPAATLLGDRIPVRRRILPMAVLLLVSIAVCIPWSLHGSRALAEYNRAGGLDPIYDSTAVTWTQDAQDYMQSLPAFARDGNYAFITSNAIREGRFRITEDDVRMFFRTNFGAEPEPLTPFVFVSAKGPLDFALANDTRGDGGFNLLALEDDLEAADALQLGRPSHNRVFNHGLSVGVESITGDFGGWLGLVGRKLVRFGEGITLGVTARNAPYGLEGERPAVDVLLPYRGTAPLWRIAIWLLLAAGLVAMVMRREGGLWLLVIAYKVAVTILFYGYARQAISILPAFALVMTLGASLALTPITRTRIGNIALWIAGAIAVIALLSVDLTSQRDRSFNVRTIDPGVALFDTPHWGEGAFECPYWLELRPAE